jgi:uncharacterized protein YndB with AHSA1/START domain/DNA-binding transcriptional ArsR family regulator
LQRIFVKGHILLAMDADPTPTLAALAEANRLRIVGLLERAPRSVGEIAQELQLRQPQVTKHLQTLQRAGLVTLHPLGTRRIYALRREPLRALRAWLEPFERDEPDADVLERYQRAIEAETGAGAAAPRTLTFAREVAVAPAMVWEAWTSAEAVRRWWAPRHFAVADCTVDATPGGALRIVLAEGDGTRHVAEGRFVDLRRPRSLSFALAPLGADGRPLFDAVHDVRIGRRGEGAKLTMTVDVRDVRPEATPVLAGMEPGWSQTLDRLVETLEER